MSNLTSKQQSIIDALVADFQQLIGVNAVVLGGSHASCTAKADSDIDIGLYYHRETPFLMRERETIVRPYNDTDEFTLRDYGG